MEVMPGYKQTEVGVIPEDWSEAPLGKHATFRTGPFGSALHKSDYRDDGVPVVNPMHIIDGKIEPTRTMTISEQVAKHLSDFRMSPGEIVIGRRGDMGRCAVVQEHHRGWLCGTGSMIIRLLNADANFLQRVLSSPRAISAIEDSSVGTTMVNLNQGTLAGLRVQIPPIQEQRAIAKALNDVDALLIGLDRLIAKKRDLKQAAMQQLLTGKERLPGFHGEWEKKQLGDVASLSKGTQLHSTETEVGGRYAHLNGGMKPSNYTYKSNTNGNTIAVSEGGNSCGFVQFMTEPYWCGGHCYSVISKDVDNHFLYQALKGQQAEIMGLRVGSGLPNVQKTSLLAFKIPFPQTISEQTAIASILSDMDSELSMLEARRDKTRDLKQAMMQELLTGRTRLI